MRATTRAAGRPGRLPQSQDLGADGGAAVAVKVAGLSLCVRLRLLLLLRLRLVPSLRLHLSVDSRPRRCPVV